MKTYRLDELSPKARAQAIVDTQNFHATEFRPEFGDIKDILGWLGFDIDKHTELTWGEEYGRWCFAISERWYANQLDCAKVREYAPQDEALQAICVQAMALMLTAPEAVVLIIGRNRPDRPATHPKWIRNVPCSGAPTDMEWEVDSGMPEEVAEYYEAFVEMLRAILEWCADEVKEQYEWETSEEYAIEAIEANEWEFDEDGKIA